MRESTKSLLKELGINEKDLEKIEASMPRKISEDSNVKIRRVYDIFERLEDDTLVMVPYTPNVPMFSPDGKSLKGKTIFSLTPNKLIIVGDKKPKKGYVYEV